MFKKEDWKSIDGYDESMRNGFEDWEFFIRILKKGGIAEVIQEPLYNYRKRNNSTTSIANSIKYDLLFYVYTKHKELYINDYENFVRHLLSKTDREELEKIKNTKRLEYKIGVFLLKPLRSIKSMLKWNFSYK